ncbi:MAG: hypothetical protein ABL904_02890 [Hyphomicrobiaceae bacterium]
MIVLMRLNPATPAIRRRHLATCKQLLLQYRHRGPFRLSKTDRAASDMSVNLVLFDDLGTHWDGGSPRLRNSFGSPVSNDEFSTYVVKNMGFIAVHGYGRSCEIRLRPSLVSPAAFAALQHYLRTRVFERIVTARYDTDWVYGLHANKDAALAKIEASLASSLSPRPGDYLVRSIAKDELPRNTPFHDALHSLIENWPTLSQSVHRDGLSNIIKQSLQGRYHLMVSPNGADTLAYSEIGNGFVSYSESWVAQAIGKAIEEHEDTAYGSWVASNCREAMKLNSPVLCDVDAIMNTSKLGRARIRYKRLFLPTRSIGGGAWLLTSSILDPTIDLRVDMLRKSA